MRVWIVCALIVGAIVAGILVFTEDDGVKTTRVSREPQPPSALSEKEVQTYIEVAPQFYDMLRRVAREFNAKRVAAMQRGEQPEKMDVRPYLDTLFQKYHLTQETWRSLSRRVEYATNVVREEAVAGERRAKIEGDIAQKRRLLEITNDEGKPAIESDIAALEQRLAWKGSPLLEADRTLIGRYFDKLDHVVPKPGP